VKRDVIRELAYHMGRRKYYSESGGSYSISYIAEYASLDSEFPVSTDPTDYESQEEYLDTVQTAKRKHIVKCLRDCVEAKVLEYSTEGEFVDDHSIEWDKVTGVRPGPRFEFAVQALLFADKTSNSMNYWPKR